jgi:hypothetical protein
MASGQSQRITGPRRWQALAPPSRNWDATRAGASAEVLQRGFELAYFLIPDRLTALDVLIRALEKVRVGSRRELKRLYWRDKHADRPVRRIARSDLDMLQWMIMLESEQEERAQERSCATSIESMVVRYIKHLVQITTALSSFYVNIGVTRLLHNYSTSEAQRAYELLTSRYLGPDEYRRAKSVLMDKLNQRFTGFLKTTRVDRGELRFEIFEDQGPWIQLVSDCLQAFTPWSTQGSCAQFVNTNGGKTKLRSAHADRNENELRCCHILIEPTCYTRLLEDLAFDPAKTMLALPRFVMPDNQQKKDDTNAPPPHPPELSQEEMDQIHRRLANTDARRRTINPRTVAIVIDGVEHMQFDLSHKTELEIALEAGASLIEVRGKDAGGDLLLATHPISYVNDQFELSTAKAALKVGTLEFKVTPIATLTQGPPRAIVSLNYQPKFQWAHPWTAMLQLRTSARAIRTYALTGLMGALVVWGVTSAYYSRRLKVLEESLQKEHRDQQQLLPTAARAIISYTLIRDDQRVRGSDTAGIPEISLRLHSPAISLQLPVVQASAASSSYSAELKTFTGDQTLMTQNFLRPAWKENGPAVETVVPSDLLRADRYYTVYLHSPDRVDRFTFKVVDR